MMNEREELKNIISNMTEEQLREFIDQLCALLHQGA